MMSEKGGNGANGGNSGNGGMPPIIVNGQYTKDFSFEAPLSPGIFEQIQKEAPDVSVNIEVKARPFRENVAEVVLIINAECKSAGKVAFILELTYGGVFTINAPEERHQAILLIECPGLLFPFARNIVADATRDGGFPPLMLGMVDFVAMYRNQAKELIDGGGDGKEDKKDKEDKEGGK